MSTIRVDRITNIDDDGPVDFQRGLNVKGKSVEGLISDVETVVSDTAPNKTSGLWVNSVNGKTYQKLSSGSWFEIKSPNSSSAAVLAWEALDEIPEQAPANQTLALSSNGTHVHRYNSSTETWEYAGRPTYTWTGTYAGEPTFTSFRGSTANITGSYTPPSGCTSFHIMMWGSTGYGGQSTGYSNLQRASPYESAGGRAYTERLVSHDGSSSYSYVLGSSAALYATSSSNSGFRSYAGTTTFNWGGGTMSCTGTGNPSRAGGVASGGSFNANGATANVSGSGGGAGSRAGDGNVDGSNGGLEEAAGVVPINFRGWRGFNFNPSPAVNYINRTGSAMSNYGSNGKPWYGAAAGEEPLSTLESQFVNALSYTDEGPMPQYTYGRGTNSHILILEYYD